MIPSLNSICYILNNRYYLLAKHERGHGSHHLGHGLIPITKFVGKIAFNIWPTMQVFAHLILTHCLVFGTSGSLEAPFWCCTMMQH